MDTVSKAVHWAAFAFRSIKKPRFPGTEASRVLSSGPRTHNSLSHVRYNTLTTERPDMGKRKKGTPEVLYADMRFLPGMKLTVCIGKKQRRYIEELYNVTFTEGPETYTAFATEFRDVSKGIKHFLMYLPKGCSVNDESFLSLIAHEACHIAMAYLDDIGEDNPASEEFAYIVQGIFQESLSMYKADQGK